MRIRFLSLALLAVALPLSSCSDNGIVNPLGPPITPRFDVVEASPRMVISQVYGAGGNSGALARNDYVELFNAGTARATLDGWSVQYASATGTGNFGSSPSQLVALSGTVEPGQYYLIKLRSTAAVGTPIPEADATNESLDMAGASGKVALVDQATTLGCNGGSTTCTPEQRAHIIDLVGYGTANFFEGPGAAPTLSATRAGFRAGNGCTDTNNNAADFSLAAPAPRNSSTRIPVCGTVAVSRVAVTPAEATVEQGASTQFTATAYDAADQPIAGATFTWTSSNANASVSATGSAKGELVGDAIITATSGGKSGDATLHVEAVKPPPAVRMSEIHYDNFGTDVAEAVEVEGPAGTDVTGWKVILYNGNGGLQYAEFVLDGLIPATQACNGRGVVYTLATDIQNGAPDGVALVDASGVVVEFLSYEGTFTANDGPAKGSTSKDIGIFEDALAANTGNSMQRNAAGTSWTNAPRSFGVCNGTGVTPPPFGNAITFSGRVATDPPLPVGFEDQIFATLRDGSGTEIEDATFTWTSETPDIASIDADGVMRALSAGAARLRATASDGTTRTYSLPTHIATASATAHYDGNAEFGRPTDNTPADELIIVRNQLITSFNTSKGTPNWVAYEIDASHFGPQDRCDCFTYDPELPAAGKYTTADYTGAGDFHGYGIDRGHLARSFDRTAGSLDNAYTYYFSNIIPQAADNNQGPWAAFEAYLGDQVRFNGKEVYVLTGPAGDKGTVKGEGLIVIPTYTWKVAVIMPKDQGIEHVDSYDDVEVIAVIMPNEAGIRNVNWTTYKTTVDEVETLTGYDLLNLLRDDIEIAVESNTKPPVAAVDGPYVGIEGEPVAMSGAQSTDADGDRLIYSWTFGDGRSGSGVNVSHTYQSGGTFTVRLIVTDPRGLSDDVQTTATIATWSQATGNAATIVGQLRARGQISAGDAKWIDNKLDIAQEHYQQGLNTAADNQMEQILRRLDAMVEAGDAREADVAALRSLVTRIMNASS